MPEGASSHSASRALIRPAKPSEAETIASVVRAAFTTIAEEIGVDIPPVHETGDDVLPTFSHGDVVLLAEVDGVVVGTVRGETLVSGDVMVRRLGVLPAYRGAGIARGLMRALEKAYPDVRRFELFTGAEAAGPIALYKSLGYEIMEPQEVMGFPLVYLEKCR